jgi:hypothetical protein
MLGHQALLGCVLRSLTLPRTCSLAREPANHAIKQLPFGWQSSRQFSSAAHQHAFLL